MKDCSCSSDCNASRRRRTTSASSVTSVCETNARAARERQTWSEFRGSLAICIYRLWRRVMPRILQRDVVICTFAGPEFSPNLVDEARSVFGWKHLPCMYVCVTHARVRHKHRITHISILANTISTSAVRSVLVHAYLCRGENRPVCRSHFSSSCWHGLHSCGARLSRFCCRAAKHALRFCT